MGRYQFQLCACAIAYLRTSLKLTQKGRIAAPRVNKVKEIVTVIWGADFQEIKA